MKQPECDTILAEAHAGVSAPSCPDAHTAAVELAAELIARQPSLRLRVTGASMLPAIRPGDILHVSHCRPADAAIGDIVLVKREARLYAHRVIFRSDSNVVTRGDVLPRSDPATSPQAFLGRVTAVSRGGARFAPKTRWTLGRLVARAACRSARASRWLARLYAPQQGSDA